MFEAVLWAILAADVAVYGLVGWDVVGSTVPLLVGAVVAGCAAGVAWRLDPRVDGDVLVLCVVVPMLLWVAAATGKTWVAGVPGVLVVVALMHVFADRSNARSADSRG
jgi:uncharacterized membrane protein (UPF0136 family)